MKNLSTDLSTDLSTGLDKLIGIWNFDANKHYIPVIDNLYGINFKPVDIYKKERRKLVAFLGKKYLLAIPVKKIKTK